MLYHDEIESRLKWLQEMLRMFVQHMNVEEDAFTLSLSSLINIVMDVNEDISKIKQFHPIIEQVSVAREVSLYCYYILKRKPIIVLNEEKEYANQINERFCAILLLSHTEKREIWDQDYIQFLISMFYRGELSKDALYLLAINIYQVDKVWGKDDRV